MLSGEAFQEEFGRAGGLLVIRAPEAGGQWGPISLACESITNYKPLKPMGDVDARVHIFTAMALGRGRMASPTLSCLYPAVLILQGD